MKKLSAILLLALAASLSVFGQSNTLSSTTLSAALTASSLVNQVTVGSAPSLTLPYEIYVDREAMRVTSVNGSVLTVVRGYNNTLVAAHNSGQIVYAGQLSWFGTADPTSGCTASALWSSPLINVETGTLWTCNSASMWAKAMLVDASAPLFNRTAVAANYTALNTDFIIAVTSTAAARTITLPAAGGLAGKVYIVKDESGGAATHNITVSGTIDGSSNATISSNYSEVRLYSNGSNWFTF